MHRLIGYAVGISKVIATAKMQLTVHSKDSCTHDIFLYMAEIVILSSNTRKSTILTNVL